MHETGKNAGYLNIYLLTTLFFQTDFSKSEKNDNLGKYKSESTDLNMTVIRGM